MSYSNGRGYRGRIYGEKERWSKKKISRDSQPRLLEVEMNSELKMLGCWLSKYRYPRLGNEMLHLKFADGSGEVVRHLCGCSRCFNPAHLIRGNDIENARDETDIQKFGVELLRDIVGEKYEDLSMNEEYLVLQSRAGRIKHDKLSDIHQYIRERYRRVKEHELLPRCAERVNSLREKLLSIANYIVIKETK